MRAFHSDPEVKAKYLERVRAHFLADEIVKGHYWENGKGCAIGCTIHSDEHSSYEIELGIPQALARLEDYIFEGLSNDLAKTWPSRFLKAIEVGADLSKVWPKFAIFLLTDESQCNSRHHQCDIVAKHFQDELDGIPVDWEKVRSAVNTVDYSIYAGYAAAYAAYNATTAAIHAVNAAYYAAYYAGDATVAAVASAKTYIAQSEKLLELLKGER